MVGAYLHLRSLVLVRLVVQGGVRRGVERTGQVRRVGGAGEHGQPGILFHTWGLFIWPTRLRATF